MIQQYQFMASYLQKLSDGLGQRTAPVQPRFKPEVAVCSVGKETANGDRCIWFEGTGGRYYVLLCDGMGTGLGAAQEARVAADMLKRLLSSGFPPEHALRSLNSLCALRSRAGAVTVDLAEIRLDTGNTTLYKWGAMPSYILSRLGTEKIGTTTPPPGLSMTEGRETVERLSLRRGEVLVLLSDGVDGEVVRREIPLHTQLPPEELAAEILERGIKSMDDDATVVVIRLTAGTLPPS